MNTLKSWAWMLATLSMACLLQAEQVTIVKKNRVNVRGQASQNSEVITQLRKGEAVVILEELEGRKPKKGEPIKWAKIQLPSNTPVWVFAPYVDASTKTVNSRRLNIRSGPGENFSIIGRLDRGASVKEIRTIHLEPNLELLEKSYKSGQLKIRSDKKLSWEEVVEDLRTWEDKERNMFIPHKITARKPTDRLPMPAGRERSPS